MGFERDASHIDNSKSDHKSHVRDALFEGVAKSLVSISFTSEVAKVMTDKK